MKYLEDDIPAARRHLEAARRLGETYGFQRELSEYWHMNYHFLIDEGKHLEAYNSLEKAFTLSMQYGNVYMQLDCLMHMVQRVVKDGEIEKTFDLIRKLEAIEQQGAGIVVFRGRSLIYQGDGLLSIGQRVKGFHAWREGFLLVARFGNSRTNVELLSDLIDPRRDQFKSLEAEFDEVDAWPTAEMSRELPGLAKLLT